MLVLIFSKTFAKTFLILRIQRDMFTHTHTHTPTDTHIYIYIYICFHVNNPLFLSDIKEIWIFSPDFRKIHKRIFL